MLKKLILPWHSLCSWPKAQNWSGPRNKNFDIWEYLRRALISPGSCRGSMVAQCEPTEVTSSHLTLHVSVFVSVSLESKDMWIRSCWPWMVICLRVFFCPCDGPVTDGWPLQDISSTSAKSPLGQNHCNTYNYSHRYRGLKHGELMS